MKIQYLFILLISILFCKCSDFTSPADDEKAFGIYLLKDTLLITSEAKKIPLESLLVQEKPIVNINDIIEYNWSEHLISLTPEAFEKFKTVEGKIKSTDGLPFIVIVNEQKIYLGNISPYYSSYIHIDLPYIGVTPFTEMKIDRAPSQNIEDKRIDIRIYNVLKSYSKLKM